MEIEIIPVVSSFSQTIDGQYYCLAMEKIKTIEQVDTFLKYLIKERIKALKKYKENEINSEVV